MSAWDLSSRRDISYRLGPHVHASGSFETLATLALPDPPFGSLLVDAACVAPSTDGSVEDAVKRFIVPVVVVKSDGEVLAAGASPLGFGDLEIEFRVSVESGNLLLEVQAPSAGCVTVGRVTGTLIEGIDVEFTGDP